MGGDTTSTDKTPLCYNGTNQSTCQQPPIEAEMQHWFILLLKFAVTALILALFIRQFDIRSMGHALLTISPYAIVAAVVAVLAQSLAAAVRFVMVVARFGPRFGLADSYRLTLESMFFSQTFISFLGGDALRIWRIRRLGLALPKATSAVVLDRLIGTLVNHAFLLATLPWFLSSEMNSSIKIILVILAVAGVTAFAMLLLLGSRRGRVSILDLLPVRIRAGVVSGFIVEISTVGRDLLTSGRVPWVFVLSALITSINIVIFALILSGMGVVLPLAAGCALLVPAIMEIAMLPISLAGWGVREGAAVVAFGALGLPADQALAASITFGLTVAGVSMLGGVLWLVDRRQMPQLSMELTDGASAPPSSTR
jgi:glycosyltransferase 2 family protein